MSAPSSWTPGGAAVPGPLYSEPRRGHPHIVSALAPPKYPFRGSITRLAHAPSYASPCGSPRTAQGLGFPGVDSSWGRTCSIRRYSLCISLTYLLMPVFPGAYVPVGTALSGRPPDRAPQADFPHEAPTFGLRASEASNGPGVYDARFRKRIAGFESLRLLHRPSGTLASPL